LVEAEVAVGMTLPANAFSKEGKVVVGLAKTDLEQQEQLGWQIQEVVEEAGLELMGWAT